MASSRTPRSSPGARRGPGRVSEDEAPFRDAERGERIQRVLADAGVASRRACETLVEEGRVEVNGILITGLPAWVDPTSDRVSVDGKAVVVAPERPVYIMLNKPTRTVTT
ncbi:MAG: S4 domain-containing protein, partial [Planctomycetota bacterium]